MSKEKKYRFYYSKKQDSVDEDMWGFTPRYTFVKTPNGYKQYSELCSIKGTRCNWEDSELVYESDEMPEIIVHEAIPELIADLEAKLSESEVIIKGGKEEIKDLHRKINEIVERDMNCIQKLKQQLAEKEKEETKRMEDFEKGCQEYYSSDKYKKDFAIAELEQLKHDIWTNQHDDGWLVEQVDIYELTEMIDQQIKKLKGDK